MNPGRLLVGVVLVALGIVLLLDRLGVASAGQLIGALWPLVIVAAGVLQIAVSRRANLGAAITIVVGLVLLAATLNVAPSVWQFFWPVVLIAVGLLFLAGIVSRGILGQTHQRDDVANAFSVFGGQKVVSDSQQFRSASLTSFFGGVTLDLRQANLAPEGADVDVMTAFGGAGILVPEGWRVSLSGIPIFGGFDDKTSRSGPQEGPELRVRGMALFGGVDVKNRP